MGVLPALGDEANITWVKLDATDPVHSEISWSVHEAKVPQDQINSKYREHHPLTVLETSVAFALT